MLIQIIHNPGAGNADHSRRKISEHIPSTGNVVKYVSTEDEKWEDFLKNEPDLIVIAGGDGTFHKVAELLLKKIPEKNIPVKILALGTANNISKTINIHSRDVSDINKELDFLNFSTGSIKGVENESFFFESVGFGIFPQLLEKREGSSESESAEESIPKTLKILLQLLSDFESKKARLKVNGLTIKGSFILIELMNIQFIGPNLQLTPHGDPEDDFLELVLIHQNKKAQFKKYLSRLLEKNNTPSTLPEFATIIKTKKVKIKWKDKLMHIDDKLISGEFRNRIKMKISSKSLTILRT